MCLNKPIVFYAPDIDEYGNKLRGFYFEYKEENVPGRIIEKEEELIKIINDIKIEDENKYKELKELYVPLDDGKVCERIYEHIKDGIWKQ